MQPNQHIEIDDLSLSKLFPFYFVLDRAMRIVKCSKIVHRLFSFHHLEEINNRFKFYAPQEGLFSFEDLTINPENQHILGSKDEYGIKLIGEFSAIANGEQLLFTGHPYLDDILDPNANLLKPYDLFNSSTSPQQSFSTNSKNYVEANELKNISLIINDEQGNIEWCNRVFQQLSHYTIGEILGKRPRQLIYGPESNYVFSDHVDTMVQDGKPFSFENIGYTKEGEKFWFSAKVFPIFNAEGVISGRFSLLKDITQDKLNDIIASENELLLKFTLESTGDAIFVYDTINRKLNYTTKYQAMLGYDESELLDDKVLASLVHPEDGGLFRIMLEQSFNSNDGFQSFETRLMHKTGRYKYYLFKGKIINWDKAGKPVKMMGTISDIDEMKQANFAVRTLTEQLQILMEHLNVGILFINNEHQIKVSNKAVLNLFQVSEADINNQSVTNVFAPIIDKYLEPNNSFKNKLKQYLLSKKEVNNEHFFLKNGRVINFELIPIYIEDDYHGSILKFTDNTEQFERNKAISETKQFYERILNELPVDVVLFDLDGNYLFINKYAVNNDEVREWLIGKSDYDYFMTRGGDMSRYEVRKVYFNNSLHQKVESRFVEEYLLPNGTKKHKLRVMYPCFNNHGNVDIIMGYGMDITDLKNAELNITELKNYYHKILDTLPFDLVVLDTNKKFKYINQSAIKESSLRDFLIGKDMYDYCNIKGVSTKLADERAILFDRVLEQRKMLSTLDDYKTSQLNDKHILRQLYPCLNEAGEIEYVIIYGFDITEQVQHQRKSELQEKRLKNLFSIINDGIVRIDNQGFVSFINPAFERIMNIQPGQAEEVGINFFSYLDPKDVAIIKEKLLLLKASNLPQDGMLTLHTDGDSMRYLDYTLTYSQFTEEAFYVARVTDITEKVEKERNMSVFLNKVNDLNMSKSQFMRITSHELRTPLEIILSNTELLEMILARALPKSEHDTSKMLNRIVKEVNIMTEILNQLMMVSKIEEGKVDFRVELVDIADFINEIKEELFLPNSDGRNLVFKYPKKLMLIQADRRLLRNAVVNLLKNAFKYSFSKPEPEVNIKDTGDYVEIFIKDYGIGIPEEDREKLFKPFSRASNVGTVQGTGIGLMVVEYVAQQHGGSITYKSKPNVGTTFCLKLPKKITMHPNINENNN